MDENNPKLGILQTDQEYYKIFNGTKDDLDDFVAMRSPWSLIHVKAVDNNGNEEDHILSCFKRNEMGRCYLVESAAQMFFCSDSAI